MTFDRRTFLAGLLLSAGVSSSASASLRRYYYDAVGRLRVTSADNGVDAGYFLDAADNRTRVLPFLNASSTARGRLGSGQQLLRNQSIDSAPNATCFLTLQGDGNLVMYKRSNSQIIWGAPTQINGGISAKQGSLLDMQGVDGNLVLYDGNYSGIFSSNTAGNPGAYLSIPDDAPPFIMLPSGQTRPL